MADSKPLPAGEGLRNRQTTGVRAGEACAKEDAVSPHMLPSICRSPTRSLHPLCAVSLCMKECEPGESWLVRIGCALAVGTLNEHRSWHATPCIPKILPNFRLSSDWQQKRKQISDGGSPSARTKGIDSLLYHGGHHRVRPRSNRGSILLAVRVLDTETGASSPTMSIADPTGKG